MSEERSAGGVTTRPKRKNMQKKATQKKNITPASPSKKKNNVGVKIDKTNRRDSMGGFPSLKSADSIRLTKAEKRLGKKASEKFIDVRTGPKPSSPKKKKSGSPKPNSKADTKSTKTNDRSDSKSKKSTKKSPRNGKKKGSSGKSKTRQKTPRRKQRKSKAASKANDSNSNKDSDKISVEADALDES